MLNSDKAMHTLSVYVAVPYNDSCNVVGSNGRIIRTGICNTEARAVEVYIV